MSRTAQKPLDDDDLNTYRPKVTSKSVIIQRGTIPKSRSSMSYSMSGRQSMGSMFNPKIYSQITSTGIADFRSHRESEKREMQDLNERLAGYIEKVRFLEAKIKQYEAELEALRSRKQEDWKPIRDMYEGELDQARKVIAELSSQKGVSEARLAGYQDEIQSLKDLIGTYDNNAKDYAKKIDQLNSQIGEYEGELTSLRLRCGNLEDENLKLRDIINKMKEETSRLRADLDAETAAHIEQEVEAQSKTEECEFLKDLLDKLELLKVEPVTIGGQNLESFYKGEIKACVRDIQRAYEEQIETITYELENKYASQMNQLRSGNVRENMEIEHSKEESKRLRDQLSEAKRRITELETLLGSLRAERDSYQSQLQYMETELDRVRTESARQLSELQKQVEALVAQLEQLIDAKMSLELEISCYKKLLEGEENRSGLRQLVEQTVQSRGAGAGGLAQMISESSMASTTARTMVQRSSKGAIGFKEVEPTGGSVTIENTSTGARAKAQSLKGWTIVKEVNNAVQLTVELPPEYELRPGKSFIIWAKGKKSTATNENEMVADIFSFGSGTGKFILLDDAAQEKGNLTIRTVNQ